MARDLERARGLSATRPTQTSPQKGAVPHRTVRDEARPRIEPPPIPSRPSAPPKLERGEPDSPDESKEKQRTLSQILADARRHVAAAESDSAKPETKPSPEPPQRIKIEDMKKSDILPIEPSPAAKEKISQIPPKKSIPLGGTGAPPPNLPTGEPSLARPDPTVEMVTPEKSAPPAEMPAPLPPKEDVKPEAKPPITPEEILGIAPKKAILPPEPPKPPELTKPPISPLEKTVKPSKEQPPKPASRIRLKTPPSGRAGLPAPKFILITGALGFALIALGYGVVTEILLQEPVTAPPQTLEITEPPLPDALIETTQIKPIKIANISYGALKSKIDALQEKRFLAGSLAHIPIKLSSESEIRYLTLVEIFAALQIDAPPILNDYKNFTLFLYSQDTKAEELCTSAGIADKSCYGPRIGIIIEMPDPGESALTISTASNVMEEWEKTIVDDLRPLMLAAPQGTVDAQGEEISAFSFGKHKNFITHYINLPIPTTSVDWLIADSYLVIATSKDAARAAADNLK